MPWYCPWNPWRLRSWCNSGAMPKQKRSGDRESPWNNPLRKVTGVFLVPFAVCTVRFVFHSGMRSTIALRISLGGLMALNILVIHMCGVMSNAFRKSIHAMDRFLLWSFASPVTAPSITKTSSAPPPSPPQRFLFTGKEIVFLHVPGEDGCQCARPCIACMLCLGR